jgi:hypothetical protein
MAGRGINKTYLTLVRVAHLSRKDAKKTFFCFEFLPFLAALRLERLKGAGVR